MEENLEIKKAERDVERFRAELARNFRAPLVSYFYRRVRNRAEAEDLTQDVLLKVLHQSETVDPTRAKAYIFTAAGNLLRDRARRSAVRQTEAYSTVGATKIPELIEEIAPDRVLEGKETLRAVLLALDGMNRRTRDIFVLYRIEKMKQREIAQLLGLSHATVENHLVKAMTYLTERFGRP